MSFEGLVALFVFFEFCVERPKVLLEVCQAVAGPLSRKQDEGCVAKVISMLLCGGSAPIGTKGGRTARQKKKLYDCTLGYPGEDVATRLH